MPNVFSKGIAVKRVAASLSFWDDQPSPPKELDAAVYRHGCDPPLR